MIAISTFSVSPPMVYCAIAVDVPSVVSPGTTKPTGKFVALGIGVKFVFPGVRMAKVMFAVEMSPWQAPPISRTVALSVSVAVLLLGLVVQKKFDPVYIGCPFAGPMFGFLSTVKGA